MNKISKKQIRKSIADAINKVLSTLKTSVTSRKGEKLLDYFSRKYAAEVKKSMKKSVIETPKSNAPTRKSVKRTPTRKPIKKNK